MRVHYSAFGFLRAMLAALLLVAPPAWAATARVPQVEANHMRWEKSDVVLSHAIAWQEERGGSWVTVVLLTDKPIVRQSIGPGKGADEAVEKAKAQGFSFAIASGGVPLASEPITVWFRDGAQIRSANVSGVGGFDIASQSASQIKGRAVMNAFGMNPPKGGNAWSVSFDAPVAHGDAKRMQAEGEPLGAAGGQPGKDLQAALEAKRKMDYAAILAYASPELATYLGDAKARDKNLKFLQRMTPPEARIAGGSMKGDKAKVYWVQVRPDALDSRCIDDMVLVGGKWRSAASICAAE